ILILFFFFFFFSSRRRHTRLQGDWSSDVCSSDLSESRRPLGGMAAGSEAATRRLASRHRGSGPQGGGDAYDFSAQCADACSGVRSEERRVGKECRCWWWAYD